MLIPAVMSFNLKNRLIIFFLIVLALILSGSLGYVVIKIYVEHSHVTFTDAIYFSVATISTLGHYPPGVGFKSTVGKWFTIFYLAFGLAIIFGGVQTIIGPWLELKIKRAERGWMKPVPKDEHVIICGYNEITKYITKRLDAIGIPYVVVDANPPVNIPHIRGDPTESDYLKSANISRASALLLLMDDASNALIASSAKRMNPDVNVVCTASSTDAKGILKKAGADVVISTKERIARHLEMWIKGDIKQNHTVRVRRKDVDGELAGKSISEAKLRETLGTVIAVYRGRKLIIDPKPDFTMKMGDVLIYLEGGENA